MAVIHQWLMQYVTEQLAPSTSRQCLINELHAEAGNRKYRQSISFSLLESLLIQTRHEPLELWKAKIIPENVFDLDFDGFNDSIHSSWKPLISISIGHFHTFWTFFPVPCELCSDGFSISPQGTLHILKNLPMWLHFYETLQSHCSKWESLVWLCSWLFSHRGKSPCRSAGPDVALQQLSTCYSLMWQIFIVLLLCKLNKLP